MNRNDLLMGAGIGATLVYILDPARGRQRRALVGDQITKASRKTRQALDATAHELSNRATGVVAAMRGRFTDGHPDDATLVERVRAKLGRMCSHPRAIHVEAVDGDVSLRGQVLASEADNLVATVAKIRGVRSVRNELDVHDSAEGIPSLQGSGRLAKPTFDVHPGHWAPGTRALLAAGLATIVCIAAYARR